MLKTFDFEKIPIVEIVNEILYDSAKRGASDIHFDPGQEKMKIRIRIDGALEDYAEIPNAVKKNLTTRVKIISGMNITESRLPQDGAIKATIKDMDLDLRVSVLPLTTGEKIVIRILDYTRSLAGLEQLDFSEENLKKVLHMIGVPNGIVLVTGATGSGKSTTVYSILQRLNTEVTNLITVEDPVEMDIEGINQVQTNSEIGLTFAAALRSILRQDPNIIMIGEVRDTETAKIAVRASITGHLVLTTIHTNDSLNTIERLLDMEVERYLLASALTGIISQKLARRLCPHCKKMRPTNEYEKNIIKKVTGKEVTEIYEAVGCEECKGGYNGRIAIHEVLLMDQDIKDAISSNVRKDKLRHLVYNENVTSLLQDGINKVLEGLTTLEELLKIIELDDDSRAKATGLENAMEANELIQQDLMEHQANIVAQAKKEIARDTIVPVPVPVESNQTTEMFVEPNTLVNNNQVQQVPVQQPVVKPAEEKISEPAPVSVEPEPVVENHVTEQTEPVVENHVTEQADPVIENIVVEEPQQEVTELPKPTSFGDKKTLFSNKNKDRLF